MSNNGFRLLTLGRTALLSPDGGADGSLGTRRRKLAVLAYLALARRPVQRQALLELFWGGQGEERARHSLSDALSHLRRVLGPGAITARLTEIALAPDARLVVDAAELVSAAARGDYAAVLQLYQGPFLAGVEVPGSPGYEAWLMRERERLRLLLVEAAELHATALAREGSWDAAAEAARRWLQAEPTSPEPAVALLTALRAPGTREGHRRALSEYRQLSALLSREYDWEPHDGVAELAAAIAREAEAMGVASAGTEEGGGLAVAMAAGAAAAGAAGSGDAVAPPAPGLGGSAAPYGVRERDGSRGRGRLHARGRWALAAAVLGIAAVVVGMWRFGRGDAGEAAAPAASPSVAVLDVRNLTGAPADAWLEQGLPQMITSVLFRAGDIDVVPPERVREVRRRSAAGPGPLALPQALDLARRLGVRAVARGGLSHGAGAYVLDVTVYDVASGRMLQLFTVSDSSVLKLADAAAARLAGVVGGAATGPEIAGAETSDLEAYRHFVRALQAYDEGRGGDAGAELEAALRRDPEFVAALRLRARLARDAGDHVAAEAALAAIARAGERASPFDRLEVETYEALIGGKHARAESLGRELVRRYPRDPRAYRALADVLFSHGDFAGEESVLARALALDSLGMEAGRGPCVPCLGYGGLVWVRLLRGDTAGAAAAGRRWVRLQPEIPSAWATLAGALSMGGDFAGAVVAQRRAEALDPSTGEQVVLGRVWLMAGRYDAADSLVRVLLRRREADARETALDLRATLQRERGQFRAAAATLRQLGDTTGLTPVTANTLARIGRLPAAVALYERAGHEGGGTAAQRARGYCWAHALEAADLAAAGDTAPVAALADSIEAVARQSYYARDWRLVHHLRGLLAARAGRLAVAERELQAARFGVAGWTATNLALARVQLRRGETRAALLTLRQSLIGPLDGMGRYVPRTELEFELAQAYRQAGQRDSARVYAAGVRRAWAQADPDVRARLVDLPD